MTGHVYFIRAIERVGLVKIGFTTDPGFRMSTFQKGSPVDLEFAVLIEGDYETERRFHTLFAADHVRNEWFSPSDQMDAVIAALNAGEPVLLPEARTRPIVERRPRSRASRIAQSANAQIDSLRAVGVKIPVGIDRLASELRHGGTGVETVVAFLGVHGRQIKGLSA